MPLVLLCLWCCVAFAPNGVAVSFGVAVPLVLRCMCGLRVGLCCQQHGCVERGQGVSVASALLGHKATAASPLARYTLVVDN